MAPHFLSAHDSLSDRAESRYPHGDPSWGVRGKKVQGQKPTAEFVLGQHGNTVTDCVGDRHYGRGNTHQEGKTGNSGRFPSRNGGGNMITLPDRAEEKRNLALAKQRQMRTDHWTDK